jgi:putative restriction endonuclease
VLVLQDLLAPRSARHRIALEWFKRHAGTEQPWPDSLATPDGPTFLATRAKGIYKPSWTQYALSARQVLNSRYPEKGPYFREDGTWSYGYFQDNDNPEARDSEFTNRGLMLCWRDAIPIGVMHQTSPKPAVRYQILGLALVVGWDGGYFFFEGFGPHALAHPGGTHTEIELLAAEQQRLAVDSRSFDPTGIIDSRQRVLAQIVRRRGQQEFRERLLIAYGGRCAITGCDAVEALEAAHIVPYQGDDTNSVQNGLLLRADIHTLFDLGLIGVRPDSMVVVVSERLRVTIYRELAGVPLRVPVNHYDRPSSAALHQHLVWGGL